MPDGFLLTMTAGQFGIISNPKHIIKTLGRACQDHFRSGNQHILERMSIMHTRGSAACSFLHAMRVFSHQDVVMCHVRVATAQLGSKRRIRRPAFVNSNVLISSHCNNNNNNNFQQRAQQFIMPYKRYIETESSHDSVPSGPQSMEIKSEKAIGTTEIMRLEDDATEDNSTDIWSENSPNPKINVHFIRRNGNKSTVKAPVGVSLLEVAHHNDIEIEGACEASLACSTCHIILDDKTFRAIPEASDKEDDLLDMAPHLTDTSRLSCQVILTKELNDLEVTLPASTLNFYVDGHVPKPH